MTLLMLSIRGRQLIGQTVCSCARSNSSLPRARRIASSEGGAGAATSASPSAMAAWASVLRAADAPWESAGAGEANDDPGVGEVDLEAASWVGVASSEEGAVLAAAALGDSGLGDSSAGTVDVGIELGTVDVGLKLGSEVADALNSLMRSATDCAASSLGAVRGRVARGSASAHAVDPSIVSSPTKSIVIRRKFPAPPVKCCSTAAWLTLPLEGPQLTASYQNQTRVSRD